VLQRVKHNGSNLACMHDEEQRLKVK